MPVRLIVKWEVGFGEDRRDCAGVVVIMVRQSPVLGLTCAGSEREVAEMGSSRSKTMFEGEGVGRRGKEGG